MSYPIGTARRCRASTPTVQWHATGAASRALLVGGPLNRAGMLAMQQLAGNQAAVLQLQNGQNSSEPVSRPAVQHVSWTGDPVSMANALRNLLLKGDLDRIADSLGMLWVRGMVDTLRMLKLDAGAFASLTGAVRFKSNSRLMAALDVVGGRAPATAGLFPDQVIEFRAMHDVPEWPRIIGPRLNLVELPPDRVRDPVTNDPRYFTAAYDAIRRNRAMAGQYLLRTVKACRGSKSLHLR